MFTNKFDSLNEDLKEEILKSTLTKGAKQTSIQYYKEANMSEIGLYTRLLKYTKENNNNLPTVGRPKFEKVEKKLSKAEKELLTRLEKGEVNITEVRGFVAKRVFEKMLKNPDDFKFLDFFRAEMLNQKSDEMNLKDQWGKEIVARFFAGKLPPPICPRCSFDYRAKMDVREEAADGRIPDVGEDI